ncbi:hypothetical protein TEA_028374 [Camellia sinensis var. sinensis]|uniref:SDE2-like domain-containing protein n=1 Tax=Camellia sinensis var. sinensis TaxID=542762 RepID=A0A4V3WL43_CAMSN|nr:hypothetical protein TEA_028374 [Camellia sinensis var. sinensis]
MVVRIRLSRFGCKNKPFYRVMAADNRSPRDGKHLEVLGYYNPLPGQDGGKRMGLNFDRVKFVFHLLVCLRGGKGSFGSFFRGAAAASTKASQKKTNNFDACRDISEQRLHHVNMEKKLKE